MQLHVEVACTTSRSRFSSSRHTYHFSVGDARRYRNVYLFFTLRHSFAMAFLTRRFRHFAFSVTAGARALRCKSSEERIARFAYRTLPAANRTSNCLRALLCAGAVTRITGGDLGEENTAFGAEDALAERKFDVYRDIPSS